MLDKKYALGACYFALAILLVLNAFTHHQIDGDEFLALPYFIAQGLVPHADFFDPHPLFQNFLLAPLSWITGQSPSIITLYNLLAIALILVCARLTYTIAKDNGFKNPHAASLLFLAGYTAMTSYFLRYDFWEVLFLLLFLWCKRPFLKGVMLGFLLLMTPVFVFPTGILIGTYLLTNYWHQKRKAIEPILGIVLGVLLVVLVHLRIPLSSLIYDVITWNSALGKHYTTPLLEVLFFSVFFIIMALLVGLPVMLKYRRTKNIAVLGLSYVCAYLIQIVLMNIVYGLGSRIKLPAAVPVIAFLLIFVADYKPKWATFIIISHLTLLLLAFTPSLTMPQLHFVEVAHDLNACVAPDAKMMYDQAPAGVPRIPLFRQPSDYYWFLRDWFPLIDIKLPAHPFNERVYLCGNTLERADITCSDEALTELQQRCDTVPYQRSLWQDIRGDLRAFVFG